MKKLHSILLFILLSVVFSASAQSLNFDNVAPHPRLLLTKGDVTKMREMPANSASATVVNNKILAVADSYLDVEAVKYQEPLTAVSQEVLKRVFYLSYAHAMTDDMRYVAAAEREMMAVSEFEKWGSGEFSSVAEFTMALSIGYDWLYRRLSVRSRSIIGTAIYEKGLRASEGEGVKFWDVADSENLVCNAGLVYGALATLERSPEYCKELISKCVESNKKGQKMYGPDGVYPDELLAWEYGTGFEVMLVAALQSALGTDAGLTSQESFMRSGEFVTHLISPSEKIFGFGDCNQADVHAQPVKYWFAQKKIDLSQVAMDERLAKGGKVLENSMLPLYMIFTSSMDLSKSKLPEKKWWCSRGEASLFTYRSGWEAGSDYFAIKGGKAQADIAHQDVGSFVYEVDGIRWAVECDAKAGNILSFNSQPQKAGGKADIVSHNVTTREKQVEMDLSAVYADGAQSVKRSVHLDKKNNLTLTDEISGVAQPSIVEWSMLTEAEPQIVSPQIIMLTQDGKTLYVKMKSRSRSEAKIWSADGSKAVRVGFVSQLKSGDNTSLEVMMSPVKPTVLSRIKSVINFKR